MPRYDPEYGPRHETEYRRPWRRRFRTRPSGYGRGEEEEMVYRPAPRRSPHPYEREWGPPEGGGRFEYGREFRGFEREPRGYGRERGGYGRERRGRGMGRMPEEEAWGYGREYGKTRWETDYGDPFRDRERGTPIRMTRGRWSAYGREFQGRERGMGRGYGEEYGYGRPPRPWRSRRY